MPASATRQRPPIPVQRQDGLRREERGDEGGAAFRSAFDDVGGRSTRGTREEGDQTSAQRLEADHRSEAERARPDRDEAHRAKFQPQEKDDGSGTAQASRPAEAGQREMSSRDSEAVQAKGADQQASNDPDSSSTDLRGGFGSDPSVSAGAEAGGSAVPAPPGSPTGILPSRAPSQPGGANAASTVSAGVNRALGEDLRVAASTPWGTGHGLPGHSDSPAIRQAGTWAEPAVATAMAPAEANADNPAAMTAQPVEAIDFGASALQALAAEALDARSAPRVNGSLAGLDTAALAGLGVDSGSSATPLTGASAATATSAAPSSASVFRGGGPATGPSADSHPAGSAVDHEPLPGSVNLRGLRGARVQIPLGDGEMMRARVDLVNEQVDVRIVGGPDAALMAERREGDLREGLAEKGLQLGDFGVATSDEGDAQGSNSSDAEGASRGLGSAGRRAVGGGSNPSADPATDADPGITEADDGNGQLLNLRL